MYIFIVHLYYYSKKCEKVIFTIEPKLAETVHKRLFGYRAVVELNQKGPHRYYMLL